MEREKIQYAIKCFFAIDIQYTCTKNVGTVSNYNI